MACPQKERGYTAVAHEIMEALAIHDFNGRERAILDIILRETYGRHRTAAEFPSSSLGVRTGIDPAHVRSIVRRLVERRVLQVVREASFANPAVIGLQKDYDLWLVPRRGQRAPAPVTPTRGLRLVQGGPREALGLEQPEGPSTARPEGPSMARPEGPCTAPPTQPEVPLDGTSLNGPKIVKDKEDKSTSLSPTMVPNPGTAAPRPEGEREASRSRSRTGRVPAEHPAAHLPERLRQRLEAAATILDLAGPSAHAWSHLARLWEAFCRRGGGTEDELVAGYEEQVLEVDGRRGRERIHDATFCAARQLGQALSPGTQQPASGTNATAPARPSRAPLPTHQRGCPCPACSVVAALLDQDDGRWGGRVAPPDFAARVRGQALELQPELEESWEALGLTVLEAVDMLARGDQLAKTHRSPSLDLERLARATAAYLRKGAAESEGRR